MSQPNQVNPYAPSQVLSERPLDSSDSQSRVRTGKVILATFAGVMISGGVFGAIVAVIISLTSPAITALITVVPIGMIIGFFVAGIFLLPVVFVAFVVRLMTVPISQGWKLHQIRWFGGVCGFFSGLLSFSYVFGLGLASLVMGIVPAIFGCVGTILIAHWLVRPRQDRKPIREDSVRPPP